MNRPRTYGVVDAEMLEQFHSQDDQYAGHRADHAGSEPADPIAGAGDPHKAGEETVNDGSGVPLSCLRPRHENRSQTAGTSGERRICSHAADAGVIHNGERRAWVEAVPAEPENQTTYDRDGEIVRRHWPATVALELAAQPGAKHDGSGDRHPAADGMHNGRSCEVMKVHSETRQETACRSHCREEPIWSPAPVAENRVNET